MYPHALLMEIYLNSYNSYVIPDIWRFKALILGCPTYNTRLFPLMEHLIRVIENDNIANHLVGIFGSYGWSGGAVSALKEFARKGNWKLIEPVMLIRSNMAFGRIFPKLAYAGLRCPLRNKKPIFKVESLTEKLYMSERQP